MIFFRRNSPAPSGALMKRFALLAAMLSLAFAIAACR
jgi:hypothetical protein